jgi:hypothetical protein
VGNTPNFTQNDWAYKIGLAKEAHIDAFALNMAWDDPTNDAQLPNAFNAAVAAGGFQLFLSFDYAGNGPWEEAMVSYCFKHCWNGFRIENSKISAHCFKPSRTLTTYECSKETGTLSTVTLGIAIELLTSLRLIGLCSSESKFRFCLQKAELRVCSTD